MVIFVATGSLTVVVLIECFRPIFNFLMIEILGVIRQFTVVLIDFFGQISKKLKVILAAIK